MPWARGRGWHVRRLLREIGGDDAGSAGTTPPATAGRGCRGREARTGMCGGCCCARSAGTGWRGFGGDSAARNSRTRMPRARICAARVEMLETG
jgi:hypothetical protein